MSTTNFIKLLELCLSPSICGHMILGPIFTICSFTVISQMCATCSLDLFRSPSWLAPVALVLAGIITAHYRLAHKAYATMTQYTRACQFYELGGRENVVFQTVQEVVLFKIWAHPGFIAFLNAFEFHLPAIKATADLRNLTAVRRERYDSEVQTLRDNIDKYRAFYRNAVETEAFGEDAIKDVEALKKAIAVAGLFVSS
ncbi:hypothetical protein BDP27DRAFT_1362575 [Rhodocollybia butyracea]|uniref:Uncharacterized protein n=1 Tax=Rhodocollybia butyracea TaxID=206335 RepID=A0A9P5PYR7_9AGAR|nr:hypothetical protein BDP27DRAFT_1362575 [Rhodocollybia butyracea]